MIKYDKVLKLAGLELLHTWKLHLGDKVSVHVHENVLDHDYAKFFLLPDLIDLLEQVLI